MTTENVNESTSENTKQLVNFPVPILRGLLVQVGDQVEKDQLIQIGLHVQTEVSRNFQVLDLKVKSSADLLQFFIPAVPPSNEQARIMAASAWDITYHLRELPGVLYAEPMFATSTNSLEEFNEFNEFNEEFYEVNEPKEPDESDKPGSIDSKAPYPFKQVAPQAEEADFQPPQGIDSYWSLSEIRAEEAWKKFQQYPPGHGIIIGHPDTGYQLHSQIRANLLLEKGRDFVDGDTQPIDEMVNGFLASPGHGTSTASIIVSPRENEHDGSKANNPNVVGIAYGAKLIPLRIAPSVLLYDTIEPALASAINYATEQGVHVLSISMGGLPSLALRKAIINAQKQGVIVIAAAGNQFPFVVWPAAYDSVIAVASSTINKGIAQHSCIGSRVDVAAPGEFVLCATARRVKDNIVFGTKLGKGTSFAAAVVAGLAALWLSYHGRERLIKKYGAERISLVFDKVLRETCCKPEKWDTAKCGAGIVDAEALLNISFDQLPDPMDPDIQAPPAFRQVDHVRLDRGGGETFAHLFEEVMDNPEFAIALQEILSTILNKSSKDLRQYLQTFGQELVFHFGTNSILFDALKTHLGMDVPNPENLAKVLDELRNCSSCYLRKHLPKLIAPSPTSQ